MTDKNTDRKDAKTAAEDKIDNTDKEDKKDNTDKKHADVVDAADAEENKSDDTGWLSISATVEVHHTAAEDTDENDTDENASDHHIEEKSMEDLMDSVVDIETAFGKPDGTLDEEQAEYVNAILRQDKPFMWREKNWILFFLALNYMNLLTDFLTADIKMSTMTTIIGQAVLFILPLVIGSIVIAVAYRQERENTVVNGARVWRGVYKDGLTEMRSGLLLDVGADEDIYFIESLADIACVYVSDLDDDEIE